MPTRVVYFITSHGHASGLARLCNSLLKGSSEASIVIHHDPGQKKISDEDLPAIGDIHVLENPLAVRWGDISFVRAAMLGIRWILQNRRFNWFVWLSGQDYPIKSMSRIEKELSASSFDAYVHAFLHDDPAHWPSGEGFQRYFFRYYDFPRFDYWHRVPLTVRSFFDKARRKFNSAQPLVRVRGQYRNHLAQLGLRLFRTPFSENFHCWGGSNWVNLSRPCVEYLQYFVDEHPDVVRHYERTPLPEESLFHSILLNARGFKIAPSSKRWINWDRERRHPTSPDAITASQVGELMRSDAWFARKFDPEISAEALDLLDAIIKE